MKTLNQVLSVAISAALAVTSAPWQAYALDMAAMPEFVKTFTPPTRLGYVVNSFKGTSKQPVVLIQDLHANFGVQTKIVSMLKMFQKSADVSSKMIVGAEGAEGPIDVSYLHKQTPKVRLLASTALMKEAEIGAPLHFAINSDQDVNLVGVENIADYKLHLSLIRASVQARLKLAAKIQNTLAQFKAVKEKMAPASLNKIWKAEDDYVNGEIDLDRLARVLHLPAINSYEEVEQLLLDRKLELARASKNATFLENLVRADHYLSLLGRLFRQQMTLEEVQFTARHMDEALSVMMSVLPNEDWSEWKETIRTAIDYYAIALMRDKPLAEHAMKLVSENPDQPIFVVAGGFHTTGMEKQLAAHNISFISIAPAVESHTLKDEVLYLNRILGNRADLSSIKADVQQKPWNNFVVQEQAPAGDAAQKAVEEAGGDKKESSDNDPIATPFDVKDIPTEEVAKLPTADVDATLASFQQAFESGLGFAGGRVAVQSALMDNAKSADIAVEYGDTTDGQQEWIANVVQRDGKTVVVVNKKLAVIANRIRQNALKSGATKEAAEQRVQQAILALALSETAVVATGARNERTAMAARFGLFGMMGDAAVQAFSDLSTAGAGTMAQHFANGIKEFLAQGQVPQNNYNTVEKIANGVINQAAKLYAKNKMFKDAIQSAPVKALFNHTIEAASAQARVVGEQIKGSVSTTLQKVGISEEQNKLTKEQIDAIYHTNA